MNDFSSNQTKNSSPNFHNLLILAEILRSTDMKRLDFIKRKYENQAVDYQVTAGFMESFGLVKIKGGEISLTAKFLKAVNSDLKIDPKKFKELIVDSILSPQAHSSVIDEFLELFKATDTDMVLRLSTDDRLKYSDLRNLFVEIGLIKYLAENDTYFVEKSLVSRVSTVVKRIKENITSALQLSRILAAQELLGAAAELAVIDYEKNRLADYQDLSSTIAHTAIDNVSAGYDILSWEEPASPGQKVERYIEVKAVSPLDYRFMWSSNEIDCAHKLKNNYFLYLVPVISSEEFDIARMEMICNPYKHIFLNKNDWTKKEKVYTISKVAKKT